MLFNRTDSNSINTKELNATPSLQVLPNSANSLDPNNYNSLNLGGRSNASAQSLASSSDSISLYYYTYSYGNGDTYSGYTYDFTGKYTAGSYYDSNPINNDAGYNGKYYISSATNGYDSYSYYQGRVYISSYYDSESKTTNTPYSSSGYYGLGSESGYLTSKYSSNDYFGEDYYEADKTAGISLYYYTYSYGNGDTYSGYTYDFTGKYTAGSYYDSNPINNETGNNGKYYISSATSGYDSYSSYQGYVYINSYYDSESKTTNTPYSSSGYYGLGSESGYLTSKYSINNDYFGKDYYEADKAAGISLYYYTYSYGNGDTYSGYTYDFTGKYTAGSYYDPNPINNETGNNGKYYISSATSGYDNYSYYRGRVYISSYYDSESKTTNTPYSSSGYYGLGSESGYLTSGYSSSNDLFGKDYYEADKSGISLYYYTYSYGNGDTYSGYTYDTTGKYTSGSYYDYSSYSNETGYNGKYYISSAYSGYDSYSAYKGKVYVSSYYDSESKTTNTPYVVYNSGSGLGSEYGYLTSGYSSSNDLFGQDYYEADKAGGISLYYYTYSYGNGDTYSGYTYDTTGKYTSGSYYDYSSYSNETGYNGKYYISSAYSGYDSYSAYKGKVYVSSYYDSESKTTNTPYVVYNSGSGLGSEYGYLTSGYSSSNDLFGKDYYEADQPGISLYYYTYSYGNGDYYSGYTYDITGKYTAGSYYDSSSDSNETGYNGKYYISAAYSGYDSYRAYKGRVYVSSYYDSESKTSTTPYAVYTYNSNNGYGSITGLGDEYGYLTSSKSSNDYFGWDYYEADKSSTSDWFSTNIKDSSLQSIAKSKFSDGKLDRNDMIAILKDAKDGSNVDSTELTDLRTLVSNASYLNMADYVKVLSNKVVNSDTANTKSGIGNLYAGSSDTQMEKLISKWFLGSDRPTTSYTYQKASGTLFQNGISTDDVDQGSLGDCYYLATLASIASKQSSYIQNMFVDNGDDTYTVRFYNNGVADYLTVDKYLPTNSSGSFVYARPAGSSSGYYNNSSNELWVALAEKAYAQLNESGWIGQDGTNSYAGIEGGWMAPVMQQITGTKTTTNYASSTSTMTKQDLIDLVNSNKLLTAGFVYGGGYGVVNSHAYTITSYNSSTNKFFLRNPWGHTHAEVTWEQLTSLTAIFQWSNS